jgi:hypothetical protein
MSGTGGAAVVVSEVVSLRTTVSAFRLSTAASDAGLPMAASGAGPPTAASGSVRGMLSPTQPADSSRSSAAAAQDLLGTVVVELLMIIQYTARLV